MTEKATFNDVYEKLLEAFDTIINYQSQRVGQPQNDAIDVACILVEAAHTVLQRGSERDNEGESSFEVIATLMSRKFDQKAIVPPSDVAVIFQLMKEGRSKNSGKLVRDDYLDRIAYLAFEYVLRRKEEDHAAQND